MPPGQEGRVELIVKHTESFTGAISKSARVTTNDPETPTFRLTMRARFTPEPAPVRPARPPA